MNSLKEYFTKRFIGYFCLLFLLWYLGSFLLFISYSVTQMGTIRVALVTFLPFMVFLFSFFYFLKSKNDWNDRFAVAVGWLMMLYLLAALLVKPIYGYEWDSILNTDQLLNAWSPFLSVLISGLIAQKLKKEKKA